MTTSSNNQASGRFNKQMNRFVMLLARAGISLRGTRVLETRGRRSGQPRHTPVNLLTLDGKTYLVSTRGRSDWVKNTEAAGGELTLILGRRRQQHLAVEVTGDAKLAILRAYLRRFAFEVNAFFNGVRADSSTADLAKEAERHPVFELTTPPAKDGAIEDGDRLR